MKKNIYEYIGVAVPKDGMSTLYNGKKATTLQAQVENDIKRAIKEKAEVFVAFCGLSHLYKSLLTIIDKMGYDVVNPSKTKRDMHVKSTRYAVGQTGCFYVQLKAGYRSYVTYQCVDTVINMHQLPRTSEEVSSSIELYRYVREQFLKSCKGNGTATRLLYSSSSISQTEYNRKYKIYNYLKMDYKRRGLNESIEKYVRPACHSGYCAMSDDAKTYSGSGIVLDVNSLYPYISTTEPMPVSLCVSGKGVPDDHRYITSRLYWTVTKVTVSATLKPDGLACIYPDGRSIPYKKMTRATITLTPADRKMLFSNYDITYYSIDSYMTFTTSKLMFKRYMNGLYEKKKTSKGIQREYYKMMINGLIGMFGKRPYKTKTVCGHIGKALKIMTVHLTDAEYKKEMKKVSGLCYVNAAITSAARLKIVTDIKKNRDRWLYTDTDSIHLKGNKIPDTVPISDKIGEYKVEHRYTDVVYKGRKSYIYIEHGKVTPTIAGVPKDTFDGQHIYNIRDLYQQEQTVLRLLEDTYTGTLHYIKMSYNLDRAAAKENLGRKLKSVLDGGYSQALVAQLEANKRKKEEENNILRKLIIGFNK